MSDHVVVPTVGCADATGEDDGAGTPSGGGLVIPAAIELQVLLGFEPTILDQLYEHTAGQRPEPGTPAESIGDCYRTVIACLLSAPRPDYVPHFGAMNLEAGGGWEHYRIARHWLRDEMGIDLAGIDRSEADRLDVAYGLTVESKRGPWTHLVLARHGQVIHDPSHHPEGYTIADAIPGEPVDVLVRPYDPAPDEQVLEWRRLVA